MKVWREKPDEFLGEAYAPGNPLPPEVQQLGARVVIEPDGSETLITAEREIYPLTEGMVITIRRGIVGANTRERLERKYEETDPAPKREAT